jgi:transcriptional regulator with XRE-family HTH domain
VKIIEQTKFSARVKELLAERNVSQKQLAEAVGVTPGSVTGWKKGAIPSSDILQRIAAFFEMSVDELLTGQRVNYEGRGKAFEERVKKAEEILEGINVPPEIKQTLFEGLMLLLTKKDVTEEVSKEWDKRKELTVELSKMQEHLSRIISKIGTDVA